MRHGVQRVRQWWQALEAGWRMTIAVSLTLLGLLGAVSQVFVLYSADCASATATSGRPFCVQSSPVAVYFASDTTYVAAGTGGAAVTPTQTQICDTQGHCTNTSDTIFLRQTGTSGVYCELSIAGGIPGVRCYDASNNPLTFSNPIYSGQTAKRTIDNGSATQVNCEQMDDTGLTTYTSGTESCGRLTGVVHIELAEDDGTHTCAAGNFGLWADLSENKLKACQNGSASDLLSTGSFGETSLAGLVNNQVLWDGSQASRTLTMNLSGTDPVLTFSSATMALTGNETVSGTLGVTGVTTTTGAITANGGIVASGTAVSSLSTTSNTAGALTLNANGGTSETVLIRAQQGTGATSLNLVSTAGGITLNGSGATAITNNATVGGTLNVTGTTTMTTVTQNGTITYGSSGKPKTTLTFKASALDVDGTNCVASDVALASYPATTTISCLDNDNGRMLLTIPSTPDTWDAGDIIVTLTGFSITNQSALTMIADMQVLCYATTEQLATAPATGTTNTATITFSNQTNSINHSNAVTITTSGCAAGEQMRLIIDNEDNGTATQSTTTGMWTGGKITFFSATSR